MLVRYLHRDAIFPAQAERFDITELWVGAASMMCQDVGPGALDETLERCARRLDAKPRHPALGPVRIPTLSELPFHGYPRFSTLLAKHQRDAALAAIANHEPVIVGFRLPRRLFLEGRLGDSVNVLVFASLGHARICYLGQCPYTIPKQFYLAQQLPLTRGSQARGDAVDVWLFLSPGKDELGLNLEHGLFVSTPEAMLPASRLHAALLHSSNLLQGILIFGIFLMAIVCAVLWSDYIDFAAFAAYVSSYLLQAIVPVLMTRLPLPINDERLQGAVLLTLDLNTATAALFFAWSTVRPQFFRLWFWWIVVFFGGMAAGTLAWQADLGTEAQRLALLGLAVARAVLPALVALLGGLLIYRQGRHRDGREENKMRDLRPRLIEQALFAAGLSLTATPVLVKRVFNSEALWTYDISSLSAITLFPLFTILLFTASGKFRRRAESYQRDLIFMARQAAVGEMVQMLAHDVRKPFSLLRMGMDLLARAETPAEMRRTIDRLKPQVTQTLQSVTGMLGDIMAVSSVPMLNSEHIEVDMLIGRCLERLGIDWQNTDIAFTYDLKQQHPLEIDSEKILRVMDNIIENAVQAMGGRGKIWFSCRQAPAAPEMLELVIGNSGSFIPEDDRKRIFEAFFTKGKRGGTGLGLAVAERFVALHGGEISCRSDETLGTEFILTLPAARAATQQTVATLPRHSGELAVNRLAPPPGTAEGEAYRASETESDDEAAWLAVRSTFLTAKIGRPLRMLLVDDEELYSTALISLIQSLGPTDWLAVETARASDLALAAALDRRLDLVICDIDLGHGSLDGFELLAELRRIGSQAPVYMHSNRALSTDKERAMALGAAGFVTKPMPPADLIAGLSTAVAALVQNRRAAAPAPATLALVDDDVFVRDAWVDTLRPAVTHAFASPTEFLAWLRQHPEAACELSGVIIDWQLGSGQEDGTALAERLRREHADVLARVPFILCSDAYDVLTNQDLFVAVIPKDPHSFEVLRSYLDKHQDDRQHNHGREGQVLAAG